MDVVDSEVPFVAMEGSLREKGRVERKGGKGE